MQPSRTICLLALTASLFLFTVLLLGNDSQADRRDNREVVVAEIDASIDEVWGAFTTTEGLRTWCAPLVEIDFKIGGKMRANYDANGSLGDANTIENTILSFDPKRMLSIRATKAPAGFPFPNAIKEVWTVIYFQEASPGKTTVTQIGLGYTDTEESEKMRSFFAAANSYQLELLKESLERPANESPGQS